MVPQRLVQAQHEAAGCSAGVSAAFGAPVGGTLFAFEISKPNVFWKFSLFWKTFACCAMSVFTLTVVQSAMAGEEVQEINGAVLKFGTDNISPPTILVLPGSFIVGAICGVMGAIFVIVNSNLAIYRKKYITKSWQKLCEAAFFSIVTTSCFYWIPLLVQDC